MSSLCFPLRQILAIKIPLLLNYLGRGTGRNLQLSPNVALLMHKEILILISFSRWEPGYNELFPPRTLTGTWAIYKSLLRNFLQGITRIILGEFPSGYREQLCLQCVGDLWKSFTKLLLPLGCAQIHWWDQQQSMNGGKDRTRLTSRDSKSISRFRKDWAADSHSSINWKI